LPPE
jgi:predicted enzyme related to lactoylglutathione lyase